MLADDVDALYAAHYLSLVRLAVNIVDDPQAAEDVVQDVFAALAGKPVPRDPVRYLQRAVVNRCRSALRRRRVARAFLRQATLLDDAEPADRETLRAERRRTVLAAIDALPARQRTVVVLRYYEDLSVAQIADLLDTSPGAVSSALTRALARLQATIGDRHDH